MKPIVFKKDSVLCKLAVKFGGMGEFNLKYGVSICEYNRYILTGLIVFLLVAISATLMVCLMISPVVYEVLHLYQGTPPLEVNNLFKSIVIIGFILDAITVAVVGILKYCDNQYYKPYNNKVKEPSKLYLHWKAFKDKVCFKVTFE